MNQSKEGARIFLPDGGRQAVGESVVVGELSQGRLLVGKIREDRVEIGHVQDLAGARIQIHGVQFGIVFAGGVEPADELPDAGTIEVCDVAKIQQNPTPSVLK
jgi:hypothetical protein